ncbi:MAG: DNA helicase [Pseudomonadota bacterium]
MQFSAPIYALKRKAKLLARDTHIPLHQAQDRIARQEGFQSWSHLAASFDTETPARDILGQLEPGDLCLIGARPGQGKTRLALELAARASRLDRQGYVFTLDYHVRDVAEHFAAMGVKPHGLDAQVVVDTSDDITAGDITQRLGAAKPQTLVVIDYLQLLDQKRTNPSLQAQMGTLQSFVRETGAICLVISQIDRAFDLDGRAMPSLSDVRLPNPLDLSIFSKVLFLHNGRIQLDRAA